uniref:UDP-glucuronosyltransferase n=1 Tax=Rhabditophanes sp. KR3021 TaxID=114890 RepID=A0AC35U716_9BILA
MGMTLYTILEVPMNPHIKDNLSKLAKVVKPKSRNDTIDAGAGNIRFVSEGSWTHENTKNPFDIVGELRGLSQWQTDACEHILLDSELTQKMIEEQFDLGITEAFSYVGFGLFKMYGIKKHVSVMSGLPSDAQFSSFGLTFPIAQIPSLSAPFAADISFINRIWNLFAFFANKMVVNNAVSFGNEMFHKYAPHLKIDLDEEFKKSAFYFLNTDPLVNYAIPTSSKILQIGGFGIAKSNAVDEEYNKILSLRKQNVIVSFGSIAKSSFMTKTMKTNLFNMFRTFSNVTFIWKYDGDFNDKPQDIENVIMTKWLPQVDILNDSRCSAFLTHAGMNSIIEGAKYGVPLLTIPLYGDQPRNAQYVAYSGIGKFLDKKEFNNNGQKLITSIGSLLDNPKYKKNMKLVAKMIKNRPMDPKEIFLSHVRFAAEFGNLLTFDLPDKDMPLWKFAMLDIMMFVLSIISILSFIFYKIAVFLNTLVKRYNKNVHQKDE